jgi:hypothetical protein
MHGYAAEQTRARISAPDQPRRPLPSNRRFSSNSRFSPTARRKRNSRLGS